MSSSVFLTCVGLLCTPCVHSVTVGYYVGASGLPEAKPSASLVTIWRVLVPGSPRRLRPGLGLDHLCGAVLVPGLPGSRAPALALPLCGAVLVPGLPGTCAPAGSVASVAFPRGSGRPTCHMCLRLS